MGIISHSYIKNFVGRYDKEIGMPYYSYLDFANLKQEKFTFNNSNNIEISYFYYYYDNYQKDKLVLFLHGLGPGHTAYLAEINQLAKRGYKVLTLDYVGCDSSKGKYLGSLNEPTRDVIDLLNYLNIKEEIVLIGHSLGGFTALNIIHLKDEIKKAVIISGFLSVSLLADGLIRPKFIANRIKKYESKKEPTYFNLDNVSYLKTTKDDIYFIQSDDDQMVPYRLALQIVETIDNPHIKKLKLTGRKHNPNYTDEAVAYMNEVFGQYYYLIKQKKIKTDQDRINYFKDVSLAKLVEQDEKMFDSISEFFNE